MPPPLASGPQNSRHTRVRHCVTWPDPASPRGGRAQGGLSDPQSSIGACSLSTPLEKTRLFFPVVFGGVSILLQSCFTLKGSLPAQSMGMSAFLDGVQLGQGETAARSSEMHLGDGFVDADVIFDLPVPPVCLRRGLCFLGRLLSLPLPLTLPPFPPHPQPPDIPYPLCP